MTNYDWRWWREGRSGALGERYQRKKARESGRLTGRWTFPRIAETLLILFHDAKFAPDEKEDGLQIVVGNGTIGGGAIGAWAITALAAGSVAIARPTLAGAITHSLTHLAGPGFEFRTIDEAIAVGIEAIEALLHAFGEFFLAQLTVAVGVTFHQSVDERARLELTASTGSALSASAHAGTEGRTHFLGGELSITVLIEGEECFRGVLNLLGGECSVVVGVQGGHQRMSPEAKLATATFTRAALAILTAFTIAATAAFTVAWAISVTLTGAIALAAGLLGIGVDSKGHGHGGGQHNPESQHDNSPWGTACATKPATY